MINDSGVAVLFIRELRDNVGPGRGKPPVPLAPPLTPAFAEEKRRAGPVWRALRGPELGGIRCAHKSGNHEWGGLSRPLGRKETEGSGSRARL